MTKTTKPKYELSYGEPDCRKCKLAVEGKPPASRQSGWGVEGAKVMVILSHPAQRSKFLTQVLLRAAGYKVQECYFTYACSCPTGRDSKGEVKKPTMTMYRACSNRLLPEIEWNEPEMVLLVGDVAQKATLPDYATSRYHGKMVKHLDRIYVPMLNVDDVASPTINEAIISDFRLLAKQEPIKHLDTRVTIGKTPYKIMPGIVTVDTETVGLYGKLLGGAICEHVGSAVYFVGKDIVDVLNSNPNIHILCHHAKYDLHVLYDNGYEGNYIDLDDSQLLAYCQGYPSLKLKVLETQELNFTHPDYDSMVDAGTLEDLEIEQVAEYCGQDTDSTRRLWNYLVENADKREMNLYNTIEKPLLPVLVDMERLGIRIDKPYVEKWRIELDEKRAKIQAEIEGKFDLDLDTLSSPAKLGDWLTKQGVKLPKTGASGQTATGKELLAGLLGAHPSIGPILKWRQLGKMKATYADACYELADKNDIVHTSFNQTRVITGRLSSSEPNLQNLPYVPEARKPFIAHPGNKLVSFDYSQIDMRALAVLSQDKVLLKAFENDEDIHNMMSDALFGDHEPMHRHIIKSVSYLTIYGGSAKGLWVYLNAPMGEFDLEQMGKPPSMQECKEVMGLYFVKFPGIADYQDGVREFAKSHGYVEDYYGRRRYIPQLSSLDPRVVQSGLRYAINMPIAGTAANIFKLSIIAVGPIMTPVLNVHDELVFDIPKGQIDEMVPKLKAAMEGLAFPLPLPVKYHVGDNLAELI